MRLAKKDFANFITLLIFSKKELEDIMKSKTTSFSLIIIAIAISFLFTACMGNFALTNGLYNWNQKATGDKYLNNVIFWILSWNIYGVTLFIDAVVLNTIQFWTGKNPMAMAPGDKDIKIVKSGDKVYQITATKNRFDITELKGKDAGETVGLVYSPELKTWNLDDGNKMITIAKINGNTMNLIYPDGKVLKINVPR
jgi:hypothetical protein